MTAPRELDAKCVDRFERLLLASASSRPRAPALWRALAKVFPHRTPGPAERRLLVDILRALETRGSVRLPAESGRRWDRSMEPPVPTSVDLLRERPTTSSFPWKTFPWHAELHWVADCRSLSEQQVSFLQRVHEGFVHGEFRELAPLKYRSLQLTGDEKQLASLLTTSLFRDGRLTLDKLSCLPDALPLAWESVGAGGRMVIFENADPFAVARRVLLKLDPRPYDLVAYGGGRSVLAALGHICTLERQIETISYVGDLDHAGLDIALGVQRRTRDLGLPVAQPATELHRQMLDAASAFGHPEGWPAQTRVSAPDRPRLLEAVSSDIRDAVERVLSAGHRIPEEVLGPEGFRAAWSHRAAASRE